MISERNLRVLEFGRIREMLAEGALTEIGASKCRALAPSDDLAAVKASQEETEEAVVILQYIGGHPMTEFHAHRPEIQPIARDNLRGQCKGIQAFALRHQVVHQFNAANLQMNCLIFWDIQ